MRIKDLYHLQQAETQGNSVLDKWYTILVNKELTELNTNDLCRMIQQNLFIEVAIEQAITYLKRNPLEGEVYDGQLVAVLFSADKEQITKQKEPLKEVLLDIQERVEPDHFMSEEDFTEYQELIGNFLTALHSS